MVEKKLFWQVMEESSATHTAFMGPVHDPVDAPDECGDIISTNVLMGALDIFDTLGSFVDWNHMYPKTRDTKWLLSKAETFMVDEVPHLLIRVPKDHEAMEHIKALGTGSFRYGFTGHVMRSPADPSIISQLHIHMVSVCPVAAVEARR